MALTLTMLCAYSPYVFIAGLVFNLARAVVVELASDFIVAKLAGRHYSARAANRAFGTSYKAASSANLRNEKSFQRVPYKASVITLGIADYQYHAKRTFQLALLDDTQISRFNEVLAYLRDEKIAIKIAGAGFAKPAGEYLEPDDLFTMERWTLGKHQQAHVQQLISLTKTTAFNKLSI